MEREGAFSEPAEGFVAVRGYAESEERFSRLRVPTGNRKARFPEGYRDTPPPQRAQGRRTLGTPAPLRMTTQRSHHLVAIPCILDGLWPNDQNRLY